MKTALTLALGLTLISACTPAARVPPPSPAPAAEAAVDGPDRMLDRRTSMDLETPRPADAAKSVEDITRTVGGHVESADQRDEKRVKMVLRVPATSLDSVLTAVGRLGKVKDQRLAADDVTDEAGDLEARLQNLLAVRERLRQHLSQAANTADVIDLERELARVQTDIDQVERRLRDLRSGVAMSRVALDIHRPRVLGPLGLVFSGAGWVIGKLFVLQ